EVVLRAGSKVVGVTGGFLAAGATLELQDETQSDGQKFALDGDSIILVADRDLVVKAQNGRGANLTPLVLGNRDLDDSEFWDFNAITGADIDPHSGFVRVPRDKVFGRALLEASFGTVIKIDADATIDLDGT